MGDIDFWCEEVAVKVISRDKLLRVSVKLKGFMITFGKIQFSNDVTEEDKIELEYSVLLIKNIKKQLYDTSG